MFKGRLFKAISLLIVVAMMNMMVACNTSKAPTGDNSNNANRKLDAESNSMVQPLFNTELAGNDIGILSYNVNRLAKSVEFNLATYRNGPAPENKNLKIDLGRNSANKMYFTSTLTDPDGNILWQFEYQPNYDGIGNARLVEKTGQDSMVIDIIESGDIHSEIYTLNGNALELEFPEYDADLVAGLRDEFQVIGNLDYFINNGYSEKEISILGQINEFYQFNDTTNSLYHNDDGLLVSDFISSDEIVGWLASELHLPPDDTNDPNYEDPTICEMAVVTSIVKCPYGGVANPACAVAVVIVFICFIAKIFGADVGVF